MLEIKGNLFDHNGPIVIPTNCEVKKNGEAVMGAGLAKSLLSFTPHFATEYGAAIRRFGHPHVWRWDEGDGYVWFTFPTKYNWRDKSDIDLIRFMAFELKMIINKIQEQNAEYVRYKPLKNADYYKSIGLPRVGCGLGGLDWETEVKPEISLLLDDRFVVYS